MPQIVHGMMAFLKCIFEMFFHVYRGPQDPVDPVGKKESLDQRYPAISQKIIFKLLIFK